MKGKYRKPSELLKLQQETGKSYWDLIGRPLYDDGKDEEEVKEDQDTRAALQYAISLKLDDFKRDHLNLFDNGKDVAGDHHFNAIKQISPDAGLSYAGYYDNPTGDLVVDAAGHEVPRFKRGSDDELADMIWGFEGFLPKVKNIGDGKMTIGPGLTAKRWTSKGTMTPAEGRAALMQEISERRARLSTTIPGWSKLPKSAQNALISYDYNYPLTKASSPKFFRYMEAGDYRNAAKQMDAGWNQEGFENGLRKRRITEQNMFLSELSPSRSSNITTQTTTPVTRQQPSYDYFIRKPVAPQMPKANAQDWITPYPELPIIKTTPVVQQTRVLPNIMDIYNYIINQGRELLQPKQMGGVR